MLSESCHLQKFSDDTAFVRCVEGGREEEYRGLTESFVRWCGVNHLRLNVAETLEIVVDVLPSACINGSNVEIVRSYKYLLVYQTDMKGNR